jgi:hypothetical protein
VNILCAALLVLTATSGDGQGGGLRSTWRTDAIFDIAPMMKDRQSNIRAAHLALGDTVRLVVAVDARATDQQVQFTIEVPREIIVTSGDTTWAGTTGEARGRLSLSLLPKAQGHFLLRGRAVFGAGDGTNDQIVRCVVHLDVQADSVEITPSTLLRQVTVENGHNYEHIRGWLVPVGIPSDVSDEDIDIAGGRAGVLSKAIGYCNECPSEGDTASVVVAVGERGNVLAKSVIEGSRPASSSWIAAAASAIERWRFRGAQVHGNPVPDVLIVRVPIMKAR